jgi:serine-type D-Ala-D-Ala carboxypeptidase/endopeptidase
LNNNKQYFRTLNLRKQLILSFFYTISFIICITFAISTTTTIAEIATAAPDLSIEENISAPNFTMLPSSQNKEEEVQPAKPIDFEITNDLKNLIRILVDNGTNAAIVIGLVDSNGAQFYGYGKTSNAPNATIVNENTIFDIGSITKTFTTTLLADMANEGIFKLEDPIENYLPSSVKVPMYSGQKITLEDLATHTSGLPENPPNLQVSNIMSYSNYTREQLHQALSNITIKTAPGTHFEYSNMGIAILGDILESKTGMPYEELVKYRILNVLGMNSTMINIFDPWISHLALGHDNGIEIPITSVDLVIPPPLAPAGSLRSSVADMIKYLSVNMNLIKTKLNDAIENTHMIRLYTNLTRIVPYHIYSGLGWITTTNFGSQIIWHNGEVVGYNSLAIFNPNTQRGIVILCSCTSKDIDIANIGFGPHDEFSNYIWNLLLSI